MSWSDLFGFGVPPLELVIRGSVMYLFLFLIFRVILRRDVGAIGIADVLFVVVVADASQNAMAGEYKTITDGIVLISTLVFWNVVIDRAAYRFPALGRLLEPQPLVLVRNGKLVLANLRKEKMSSAELMAKLREKGIDKLREVKRARMESDGEVSVIRFQPEADGADDGPDRRIF